MSDTGGKQFFSALQAQAMDAVKSIVKAEIYPIQYPAQGDFLWNWRNVNGVFNESTLNYINARVSPGAVAGTAELGAGNTFPNGYGLLVQGIDYSLSSNDRATVNQALSDANTASMTLISGYESLLGPITDDDLTKAREAIGEYAVSNKQDYIIAYVEGYLWSGAEVEGKPPLSYQKMAAARNLTSLLPNMPPSGGPVVADTQAYLAIMGAANTLLSQQQMGGWVIRSIQTNSTTPTKANGGIQVVNPQNGVVQPGYRTPFTVNSSIAAIANDLKNESRSIKIGMQVSQAQGSNVSVRVEGQAGFSIGSWLRFSTAAHGSYEMSKAQGTSMDCSVSIEYAGYSVVPISPVPWSVDSDRGWYYAEPVAEAAKNGDKDVTGFKFVGDSPGFDLSPLDQGGTFGVLTGLLIANYPTITITYQNANFDEFEQAWDEGVSGNLTLFGFIELGSFSQGAYGSSFSRGSTNEEFSVTFSASKEVLRVPELEKQAYVIGGMVDNPGADSPGKSIVAQLI